MYEGVLIPDQRVRKEISRSGHGNSEADDDGKPPFLRFPSITCHGIADSVYLRLRALAGTSRRVSSVYSHGFTSFAFLGLPFLSLWFIGTRLV
jgi:hypothetical protein